MKRVFSEGEDRVLREQAAGRLEISIHRLEVDMKTSRETLFRRAAELGIELKITKRSFYDAERGTESLPSDVPYRIKDDLLLKRLKKYHGGSNDDKATDSGS